MLKSSNDTYQILQDAWSFENRLLETFERQQGFAQEGADRRVQAELLRQTQNQRSRIVRRLTEVGMHPEGFIGVHTGRLTRQLLDVTNSADRGDERTSFLLISYGIKQLELRMYRDLLRAAKSCGDLDSALLARVCLEEDEAAARRLLYCIGLATRKNAA